MEIARKFTIGVAAALLVLVCAGVATRSFAAQTDIAGPTGSVHFGSSVTVLPNGNIVVVDAAYSVSNTSAGLGAVYLYNPVGELISVLTGSNFKDRVGAGGIVVLADGNFVVSSPDWSGGLGAATWVSGITGLSGVVSISNSLVGASYSDNVSGGGIVALANGSYVVASPEWSNGAVLYAGAVTWIDHGERLTGPVSTSNSLVGSHEGDHVGSPGNVVDGYVVHAVTPLCNGNFVVATPNWSSGMGAVTWVDGTAGVTGPISEANSLVGSDPSDAVGSGSPMGTGGVVPLSNCNYVVISPNWRNGTIANAGAVTWASGTMGQTGTASMANSLVGLTTGDAIGDGGVTALANGNYVVSSPEWNAGAVSNVGAVTWGNGSVGRFGAVSANNSLVGSSVDDFVGSDCGSGAGIIALSNGNYVVASCDWSNGGPVRVKTATWGNGEAGSSGAVSVSNSLTGASNIVALANGNYVVTNPGWDGTVAYAGAATWLEGSVAMATQVSASNSLTGTTADDRVGSSVVALHNGNYVVVSPAWSNATAGQVGAVTWANGDSGLVGDVSTTNSFVGTIPASRGRPVVVTPLRNGNYVIANNVVTNEMPGVVVGSVTLANGNTGRTGTASPSNSLMGTDANGDAGSGGVVALSDDSYVVLSPNWNNGGTTAAGAISLASGRFGLTGAIASWNSVLGGVANGGGDMVYDYDATRHQLVVGRPDENIVSLFTMDQIFADRFE